MPLWLWALIAAPASAGLVLCVRWALRRWMDLRLQAYQSDLMTKHYEEVEHSYRQMRGWRHDYHNHIQTLKALLAQGRTADMEAYLSALHQDLTAVDTLIRSGNVMADAIVNSKLSLAKARDIQINAKAALPKGLPISQVDLCVILGNLLDNAIEACLRLGDPKERFLRLYIDVFKDELYLSVSNASGQAPRRLGLRYLSSKGPTHGFGLARVDKVVQKYGGHVNRQHEPGVFATEVLLPLS